MNLARTLTYATLSAGSLAAMVLLVGQGCGSTAAGPNNTGSGSSSGSSHPTSGTGTGTGTSGSGVSSGSGSSAEGQPTPPPDAGATTSTTVHNFAVHYLYLGDTTETPAFSNSTTAWETIGYNIDGLETTSTTATNVCTPYMKAPIVLDGTNGIDNAFGEIIVPLLHDFANLTSTVSEKIEAGSFTIELDTVGLTASTTQSNTALGGQLFAGSTYTATNGVPALTGTSFAITDNWPVSSVLLNDGATIASGSKISFPAAYVNEGTWVSGSPVNLALSLSLAGESLTLTIHHAVLSFLHTVDASGQGHATNGIISGVLETTEFVAAINELGGSLEGGSICPVIESILPKLLDAQDLIIDPTTGDVSNTAGTPCNGISIGLGFEADEIAPPSVVSFPADAGAPGAPCGSSGTGTGSSSGTGTGSGSGDAG